MGLRRPGVREYEEMPGANVPGIPSKPYQGHVHGQNQQQRNIPPPSDMSICQDLEMSSVSVVPDGERRHCSRSIPVIFNSNITLIFFSKIIKLL